MPPCPVLQLFARGCPSINLNPRLLVMIIATRLSTNFLESLWRFPNSTTLSALYSVSRPRQALTGPTYDRAMRPWVETRLNARPSSGFVPTIDNEHN